VLPRSSPQPLRDLTIEGWRVLSAAEKDFPNDFDAIPASEVARLPLVRSREVY